MTANSVPSKENHTVEAWISGSLKWFPVVFVALMCSGAAQSGNNEQVDPAWIERAKTEGMACYEKYKAVSSRLDEVDESRIDKAPGAATTVPFHASVTRSRIVTLEDNVLHERIRVFDNAQSDPQIRLECDNSSYYFTLGKSKEDTPYALVNYAPGKRTEPLINGELCLHSEAFSELKNVLDAVEGRGPYKLESLHFDGSRQLLQIDLYSYTAKKRSDRRIYVDPEHNWRVVEYKFETPAAKGSDQVTYGVKIEDLEFPIELKTQVAYKVPKAPPDMQIVTRLVKLKITDLSPDAFRLSAFGLPEPVDVPPSQKQTPWYLWILSAAGVCAVLSFAAAYLHWRRQTRVATKDQPGVHS